MMTGRTQMMEIRADPFFLRTCELHQIRARTPLLSPGGCVAQPVGAFDGADARRVVSIAMSPPGANARAIEQGVSLGGGTSPRRECPRELRCATR